ncbi:beta-galactosidase [Dethiosulfatibacter aminovorans DSM 17477]|uniref:beta-galactosidase n=1 Tax=Dethiosulfatibacter aminovorans DSM 17477 TaxID=1121476 RepID=A0A1M6J7B3_9FIRM|nr:glycoside hydrolase family 2 TIM barrel-domain containing protein [Dethiosulfatibacter aminovorans]SHJ42545.1 beta-galactosidase [Dethiosulfatibacter aminovorans DSM 17477]
MDFSEKRERWTINICSGWKSKYIEKHSNEYNYLDYEFDDSDWDVIDIPFVWQMEGHGSPEKNYENVIKNLNRKIDRTTGIFDKPVHTGYYRKTIEIPSSWEGRKAFLKVGGVKSSIEVWVNGEKVGYSLGTMGDLYFDMTKFVKPGKNLLALKVQRFSNASFLDCSMDWFLSGIFRSIELHSEPEIFIKDLFVRSTFDDDYEDARLCVETWVENSTEKNRDLKLELRIGNRVLMTAGFVVNKDSEEKVYICKLIEKPIKWNDENPYLYDVDIVLKDNDDSVLSERRIKHGFRQVEIRKSQFLVNGTPIIFKGVNRTDLESISNDDVDKNIREDDIKLLKRNNINAVLACDFPSDPAFYDLCDKYGIYVVAELGINTSQSLKKLPEGFDWNRAALNRVTNTVKRDKNHPSIVMWYLGKDTGCGLNYLMMKDYLDDFDDSRPVSYIGSTGSIGGDVLCTQYPTIEIEQKIGTLKSIKNFFKDTKAINESKSLKISDYIKKPVFSSKLSFIEGNCLGNMYEHMENYKKYNNLCGGFISDMKDIGIYRNGNQNIEREGLIDIEGTPKPMFYEIKKVFQNIDTFKREDGDSIILEIENRYKHFTFDDFVLNISIAENGNKIYERDVIMELKAEGGKTIFEFTPEIEKVEDCEYILTVSWMLKKDVDWAPQGFELAWDQFVLYDSMYACKAVEDTEGEPLTVLETGEFISIKNSECSIIINKKTGNIKNINMGNGNILYKEILHRFDRDATDVDKRKDKNTFRNILNRNDQWENVLKKKKVLNTITEKYADKVVVYFEIEYPLAKSPSFLSYEIRNNCDFLIHNEIEPTKEMPRFGMQFELAEQLDFVRYYGKGPHENYIDRNKGAKTGIHELQLRDFNYDYLNEQERGNRTDVRWMKSYSDINSIEVEAIGERKFDFSIEQREEKTVLNVDYGQKGVGGDAVTDAEILDKYKLNKNAEYKYTFRISFKGEPYEV